VGAIVLFGLFFATLVTLVFLPALLVEVLGWRSRFVSSISEDGSART
jgi:predicted RND superfamily exporter protein